MPFTYQPFRSTLTDSIAARIANQGAIEAQRAQSVGNAWAGVAQAAGQIPAQMQQVQAQQDEQKLRQLQLQGATRQQADVDALDKAYATGVDRNAIINALPGHLRPTVTKQFADADEAALKVRELKDKAAVAERDYFGSLASSVKPFLQSEDGGLSAAMIALQHAKQAGYDNADQLWTQIKSNPQTLPQMVDQLIQASPKQVELLNATKTADARAKAADKPTEATLATAAAAGDSKATAAMSILKPPRPQTAEQDKARYVDIQARKAQGQPVTQMENAWASAYEKEKTLNVDKSASAAAERLAKVQAQQNAIQSRAQNFTEKQAGRKELADKVTLPYLDAQEKAETLRSVVEAAKSGNQVAGSVTPLMAALGLTTAEGVKRINLAEIHQIQGAGSLYERIKSRVGGLVEGKPLSDDLLNDISKLADMLETNARKKYEKQFGAVKKSYGLDDEMEPAPQRSPSAPASAVPPGVQALRNRK